MAVVFHDGNDAVPPANDDEDLAFDAECCILSFSMDTNVGGSAHQNSFLFE